MRSVQPPVSDRLRTADDKIIEAADPMQAKDANAMLTAKFQALRCTISRGGFSDERVFAIQMDELPHIGVGSRRHFWTLAGDPLDDGEPPLDQKVEGLVAATVVKINLGKVLVSIPDGEVITVPIEALVNRPPSNAGKRTCRIVTFGAP